jgi:integrase
MANLRKIPYTKPIPAGAEIVKHKGEPHARYKDKKGKTHLAPLTEDGQRIRLLSKKWYGEYKDANDQPQCVPLSTDKTAAQQMLNELVRKAELGKAGIVNPYEEHHRRPLLEHLADFEADLKARGTTPHEVKQKAGRIRRLLKACRFVLAGDLSASRVQQFLADLQEGGKQLPPLEPGKQWFDRREVAAVTGLKPESVKSLVRCRGLESVGENRHRRYPRATVEALRETAVRAPGVQTANYYLREVKSFCRWLVKDRRLPDNPLDHLQGGNPRLDRRHDRQTLSAEQLRHILDAAWTSAAVFRGLDGRDRHFLYLTAMYTGYRASELAELLPESFALTDGPTVFLPARLSKNRRTSRQPIPAALRGYLAGRPAGATVWPGRWWDQAATMLRIDLEAAGIPYVIDGPDGPLFADFHSLRHSFIALLDQSGATLKEAMQLARHSDPKLTMARYGRAQLHDLAQTVERMPVLLGKGPAPNLAATGTGGPSGESLRPACAAGEAGRERMRLVEREAISAGSPLDPVPQGVASNCDPMTPGETPAASGLTREISGCGSRRPR